MKTMWLLSMLTIFQGEGAQRYVNTFPSQQQCQQGLQAEARKYANKSHAEGGSSFFRCEPWQVGPL